MTLEEWFEKLRPDPEPWEVEDVLRFVDALHADGYRVVKLVAFDGTSRWRNEAVVVDEELT